MYTEIVPIRQERKRGWESICVCVCVKEWEWLKFLPQSCQIRHQVAKGSSCRNRRSRVWKLVLVSRALNIFTAVCFRIVTLSRNMLQHRPKAQVDVPNEETGQNRPPLTTCLTGNGPVVGGRWMMWLLERCFISESAWSFAAFTSQVVSTQHSQPSHSTVQPSSSDKGVHREGLQK